MSTEPGRQEPVVERQPPFVVVSRVLFPVAVLVCVGFAVFPRHWEIGDRLVLLRAWVPWTLLVAPVLCLVALMLGAMISVSMYAGEHPGRTLGVVLAAFVFALLVAGVFDEGRWEPAAEAVGPDGETYVLLRKEGFLVGFGEALGRVASASPFHRSFDMLGENAPNDMPDWAPVVRPAGLLSANTYQLVATPGGELLLLVLGAECHMYYDPATGRFCGDGELDWIPPFILIDETSELASGDVEKIIEHIRSGGDDDPGQPARARLVEALEHANPNVQAAARAMLDAMDATADDEEDESAESAP